MKTLKEKRINLDEGYDGKYVYPKEDVKEFAKEILEEIEDIKTPIKKNNYEDKMFNMGFENFKLKIKKIIEQKGSIEE